MRGSQRPSWSPRRPWPSTSTASSPSSTCPSARTTTDACAPCSPGCTSRDLGVGPLQQPFGGPGVDDAVGIEPELLGAGAAVDLEVELARRVGIAVDGEQAAQL